MKKIMIIAAVAMAAIASQAATFQWKTSLSGKVYSPTTTTSLLAGTFDAYVFDSAVVAQSDLVSAYAAGTLNLAGSSISTTKGSLKTGAVAATDLDYGEIGSTYNLYFAAIVTEGDAEYLFISGATDGKVVDGKTTTVNLNGKFTTTYEASAGYQSAGFYQSVPEPTSGLLLLLGMAGLALKRKQA